MMFALFQSFIKLESLEGCEEQTRAQYEELALEIFTRYASISRHLKIKKLSKQAGAGESKRSFLSFSGYIVGIK